MTIDEKKIKVAEKCGDVDRVPDYPNDLNAMNESEKVLTDDQKDSYAIKLFYIVFPGKGYELDCTRHFHTVHATAQQRFDAFGITCGLWKAGE